VVYRLGITFADSEPAIWRLVGVQEPASGAESSVWAEDISAFKRGKNPLQMPNSPVTCVVCEVHAYPAEQLPAGRRCRCAKNADFREESNLPIPHPISFAKRPIVPDFFGL
jgi:hypothetical protein